MKYQCVSCKKVFVYPAKRITVIEGISFPPTQEATGVPITLSRLATESVETHICPYCASIDLEEYSSEPQPVESIVSVKINEADAYLKQGYTVKDTFASAVTLVKMKSDAVFVPEPFSETLKQKEQNQT